MRKNRSGIRTGQAVRMKPAIRRPTNRQLVEENRRNFPAAAKLIDWAKTFDPGARIVAARENGKQVGVFDDD